MELRDFLRDFVINRLYGIMRVINTLSMSNYSFLIRTVGFIIYMLSITLQS